jgi:hypothetical protein
VAPFKEEIEVDTNVYEDKSSSVKEEEGVLNLLGTFTSKDNMVIEEEA